MRVLLPTPVAVDDACCVELSSAVSVTAPSVTRGRGRGIGSGDLDRETLLTSSEMAALLAGRLGRAFGKASKFSEPSLESAERLLLNQVPEVFVCIRLGIALASHCWIAALLWEETLERHVLGAGAEVVPPLEWLAVTKSATPTAEPTTHVAVKSGVAGIGLDAFDMCSSSTGNTVVCCGSKADSDDVVVSSGGIS